MTIRLDDPRLTAYVLGELDEKDRLEVEKALAGSAELRREVEEISAMSVGLQGALAMEAHSPLTALPDRIILEPGTPWIGWSSAKVWAGIAASIFFVLILVRTPGPRQDAIAVATETAPSERQAAQPRVPEAALVVVGPAEQLRALEMADSAPQTDPLASPPADLAPPPVLAAREALRSERESNQQRAQLAARVEEIRVARAQARVEFGRQQRIGEGSPQTQLAPIAPAPVGGAVEITEQPKPIQLASTLPADEQDFRMGGGRAARTSVRGIILDEMGAVIPGALVVLRSATTRASVTTLSDDQGRFEFEQPAAGRAEIRASLTGFRTYQRMIDVPANGVTGVQATLSVGQIAEEVVVQSASPRGSALQSSRTFPSGSGGGAERHPSRMLAIAAPPASVPFDNIRGVPNDSQYSAEAYDRIVENGFIKVADDPRSTFSIDVDTASYANVRRFLNQGSLPPADAVRIEEFINYFDYDYTPPSGEHPFSVTLDSTGAPWAPGHRLVRVALKGVEIPREQRPDSNLVFLIDVSGSMQSADKLPLLKAGLQMLAENLVELDRVAIVVYAGASGLVLPSTRGDDRQAILSAIHQLEAGGSTNGAAGIELAYQTAQEHFIEQGINRVILATDGDFNVGVSSEGELTRLIEEERKSGVFLSVLGFGTGNYKDSNLEKLADKGNGNYAYIDSEKEARKVLVDEINGTLVTIAKDVKIQVEFNPAEVESFRLIGYENRVLAHRDFNDDKKDAGEIGAGHTVTAFYEVIPTGLGDGAPEVDPLKYQAPTSTTSSAYASGELLTVKLRYKWPDESESTVLEVALRDTGREFESASDDFRFAASVAAFGMLLRSSESAREMTFGDVLQWAAASKGADERGHRAELVRLVVKAEELSPRN